MDKAKEYVAFTEENFESRVPAEEFAFMKEYEDLVLALNKENLKVIVVCSGLLYGRGEILFKKHLEAGWLQVFFDYL